MKYTRENTQPIEQLVAQTIKKYRPDLEQVKFICCWRDSPIMIEGLSVLADVAKLSNRDRDLYGYDIRLSVDMNKWQLLTKEERRKLIFHELEHVRVELDVDYDDQDDDEAEEGESDEVEEKEVDPDDVFKELLTPENLDGVPLRDAEGRIKCYLTGHDLDIRRFKSEMLMFGLSADEEGMRRYLNYIYDNVGMTNNLKKDIAKSPRKRKGKDL